MGASDTVKAKQSAISGVLCTGGRSPLLVVGDLESWKVKSLGQGRVCTLESGLALGADSKVYPPNLLYLCAVWPRAVPADELTVRLSLTHSSSKQLSCLLCPFPTPSLLLGFWAFQPQLTNFHHSLSCDPAKALPLPPAIQGPLQASPPSIPRSLEPAHPTPQKEPILCPLPWLYFLRLTDSDQSLCEEQCFVDFRLHWNPLEAVSKHRSLSHTTPGRVSDSVDRDAAAAAAAPRTPLRAPWVERHFIYCPSFRTVKECLSSSE